MTFEQKHLLEYQAKEIVQRFFECYPSIPKTQIWQMLEEIAEGHQVLLNEAETL